MTEWLQIDEEGEISVEELMRQIQMHVAHQKIQAFGMDAEFDGTFDQSLYDALIEAAQENADLHIELQVTPTPVPLLGKIFDRVRRSLHGLVLFYTNQNTARQSAVNKHVLAAIAALVRDMERSEARHKADVAALHANVVQLEAELAEFKTR